MAGDGRRWRQATALVTVTAGGAVAGLSFVPGTAAALTSPAGVPLHLLALDRAAAPAAGTVPQAGTAGPGAGEAGEGVVRAAIVNVARYYLQLAATRTPAQMQALVWDGTSLDGAGHGPWCAAFASLTLELAARAAGRRSWVSGGGSYPWPEPAWADARVSSGPGSPGVTSIVADAAAHGRWHPLGGGYRPRPGDWVVFDGHVEVITAAPDGALDTIGADSLPGLTVNAHSFPVAGSGITGYVDNGHLPPATPGPAPATAIPGPAPATAIPGPAPATAAAAPAAGRAPSGPAPATAVIPAAALARAPATHAAAPAPPALPAPAAPAAAAPAPAAAEDAAAPPAGMPASAIPGDPAPVPVTLAAPAPDAPAAAGPAAAPAPVIPGDPAPVPLAAPVPSAAPAAGGAGPDAAAARPAAAASPAAPAAAASPAEPGQYRRHAAPATAAAPGTRAQQDFISLVAPGAMAAQQRLGVPASVTIAQAIDESAWGTSTLAAADRNLFGIKGTGPAGSVMLPTSEYYNGQWVTIDAAFRVYRNVAESIADHAELLATSGYYARAMADRAIPDAFANDLTGIYATDPRYGATLIALMRLYNLYRFDTPATTPAATTPVHAPQATAPATATTPAPQAHAAHAQVPHAHAAHATPPAPGPAGTAASASIPGLATPTLAPAAGPPGFPPGAPDGPAAGLIPGAASPRPFGLTSFAPAGAPTAPATETTAAYVARAGGRAGAAAPGAPVNAQLAVSPKYRAQLPTAVSSAWLSTAKVPLMHAEPLYREVAGNAGLPWELLAACDWMQCKARPRYSPVNGEKIGTPGPDGTAYRTRSHALAQAASDLITLTAAVYRTDLTAPRPLSVRELADAYAAYRWGELLRRHHVSALEFPYSVAGLTDQHTKMRWPDIDDQNAPDRPGSRFREPFGAVPVVLSLGYPATF